MKAIRKRLLTMASLVLVFSGCVGLDGPTEKAARVQFHSQFSTILSGCKRIGPVSIVLPRIAATESAIANALRDAAAALEADTVVALNSDLTFTERTVQGMAMKCY